MDYDFEWDPIKAAQNRRKHGVSFDEAASVLLDPLAVTVLNDAHSESEERWFTIGRNQINDLLVVSHTFDTSLPPRIRVRLISARRPTPSERRAYEEEAR